MPSKEELEGTSSKISLPPEVPRTTKSSGEQGEEAMVATSTGHGMADGDNGD